MELYPYLLFAGQCEAAFKFYEKLFDGKITSMMRFSEAPEMGEVADDFQNKIMHASMTIAGKDVMASDAPPQYYKRPQGISLFVAVNNSAEVERIFNALADNGKVEMELAETFWAHRHGSVIDRFGIEWMLANLKPF